MRRADIALLCGAFWRCVMFCDPVYSFLVFYLGIANEIEVNWNYKIVTDYEADLNGQIMHYFCSVYSVLSVGVAQLHFICSLA